MTPYNTGKVKIGLAYNPPKPSYAMSRDMLKLQEALLRQPRPHPPAEHVIEDALIIAASVALLTVGTFTFSTLFV